MARLLLPTVDGRSTWARRLRDLINVHSSDYGGVVNMSEAEKSLIRRAATLTTELELMECKFAKAEDGAELWMLDAYQRGVNTLRRTYEFSCSWLGQAT